jgi:hypothetical protein
MKTITDICEHKMEQLLGTKFTHVPHDEEGEDPRRDSYKFAKRHPHAAESTWTGVSICLACSITCTEL